MRKHYFVYACSFFFSLGGNILGFSLIYRLTDRFFFTPGQIGAFVALGQVFYFIGCNLYHRFGSAAEPIKIFPAAALLVFLASIPIGWSSSQALIYGSYWVLQFCTGFYWPPLMAWLTAGQNEKELNREISLYNRSWMAAIILGPLIAGSLYQWNSSINFLILNCSYFTVQILILMLKRYSKKTGESLNETTADKTQDTGSRKYSPQYRALDKKLDLYRYKGWINAFSSTLLLGIFGNIVPLHLRDGLGYTERSAGVMLFLRSITGFIGFAVLARFTAWHFSKRWFNILQAGLLLCSIFFIAAGSSLYLFFITAVLIGLTNSGCYNNSIFYSGVTGKNPRKNLALHEIFLSVGSAVGSAGGGFLYQRFHFSGACIALAVFLFLGIAAQLYLDRAGI